MPSFGTILIGYLLIVTLVILGFLKDVSEKIKIWHMCINFVVKGIPHDVIKVVSTIRVNNL